VGGLMTASYVFVVVVGAMAAPAADWIPKARVPRYQQGAVLALALGSFLLGAVAFCSVDVVQLGRASVSLAGSR
jgi:multicomponent Na+:H+ antiporter subunit D